MKQFSYDELFNMQLDEYYDYLDSKIDWSKIKSSRDILPILTEIDAEILNKSYQKLAQRNHELNDFELRLAVARLNLRDKKLKHLKRLKKWKHGERLNQNLKL